jgi:hypothetical protein
MMVFRMLALDQWSVRWRAEAFPRPAAQAPNNYREQNHSIAANAAPHATGTARINAGNVIAAIPIALRISAHFSGRGAIVPGATRLRRPGV